MDVIIQDAINDQYLTPFKITREQVIETINNADFKKTLNYAGYKITLFLKKFDSHYVLVDGRHNDSSLLIGSAYIVGQQIVKDLPLENPLGILEQFAKEFGYEIRIGDERDKFIHFKEIKLPVKSYTNDITKVVNDNISISIDEKHNELNKPVALMDMLFNPREFGGIYYLDVALAYCINVKRYSEYLETNNLI